MRLPFLLVAVLLVVGLLVDGYIFVAIRNLLKSPIRRSVTIVHVAVSAILLCVLIAVMLMPVRSGSDERLLATMWILYAYLTVYVPKILWIVFDLVSRLPRFAGRDKWWWLSRTGGVLSVVVFAAMWWGALVNRFNIDVENVDVEIPGLPSQFDGYRIVQFSDLHVGTYGEDTTFVSRLVDEINSLNPDMIVFTGDIVNRRTNELLPFVEPLSRLSAPDGVYSILGNHDYGDYCDWVSQADKDENMRLMKELQGRMGWKLLLNETAVIKHGNDSIALIGVENIGDPPFHIYGSLKKARENIDNEACKILLTHNPAHWVDSIADTPGADIALTLSGHTHAMQIKMGRLSPASLRYKTWGGLYDDQQGRKLYVNIGAGTVGMPMRIGATPEITVITLR